MGTEAEAGTDLSPRVNKPGATQLQGADSDGGYAPPPAVRISLAQVAASQNDGWASAPLPRHLLPGHAQLSPCGYGAQGVISVQGRLRSLTTALADGWALGALSTPQPPYPPLPPSDPSPPGSQITALRS